MRRYVFNDYNGNNGEEKVFSAKKVALEDAKNFWKLLTKTEKEKYIKYHNARNSTVFEVYEIEISAEDMQLYYDGELEQPLENFCTGIVWNPLEEKKERKTGRMQVKIEPTLKALAQKKAEEQGRTLSNYIVELIRKDVNGMKLYTADRETGTFIEEVKSIEEGKQLIAEYEANDKAEGTYEENFYDIVNENHETIWN